MAVAAHENLLAPIVVDDAWVDNRSSPVDRRAAAGMTTEDRQGRMAAEACTPCNRAQPVYSRLYCVN